jgi:hypothetical protein
MIDNAEDILGVPKVKANGDPLSKSERENLIEKRRILQKIRLEPVKLKDKGIAFTFPFDIWGIITSYTECLSSLKLEKTCRSLYLVYNRKCLACDHSVLL